MDPIDVSLIILGYTFFSYSSSDKTGGENKFDQLIKQITNWEIRTSLKFSYDEIIIHFHHWLICLIGYFIFYHLGCYKITYLCLGGIIQGIINYDDWKDIIIVNLSI